MIIEQNVSLVPHTTFQVDASAKYFTIIENIDDVFELIETDIWKDESRYVLGGGSNVLFTQDYDGLVVVNNLSGIDVVYEDATHVEVLVAAGEDWHKFVLWTTERNLWGIENLVLIPGTVGASPVQNIGAYGVEAGDVIVSVRGIDTFTNEQFMFSCEECNFAYRSSIFKRYPGRYLITHVQFRLSKIPNPILTYGVVAQRVDEYTTGDINPMVIAAIITTIRESKLPSVDEIGMAGSFFKNPVIGRDQYETLLQQYPNMPSYDVPAELVKIPAGWIIETLGFKGVQEGNVGTYEKHALVLVNHGGATGGEVWNFAQKIIKKSKESFDIELEPEVRVL